MDNISITALQNVTGPSLKAATPSSKAGGDAPANETSYLDQQDFLELLVAQLQNQDPMDPLSNEEYFAQMTQFSMLNELSVLNGQVTQLAQADAITQAAGLLGREVTLTDQTGTSMTGVVDRVRRADSEIELSIDGSWWPLSSVTAVADGPAAAASTP